MSPNPHISAAVDLYMNRLLHAIQKEKLADIEPPLHHTDEYESYDERCRRRERISLWIGIIREKKCYLQWIHYRADLSVRDNVVLRLDKYRIMYGTSSIIDCERDVR
jgi:hypothetical protein